MKVMACALKLVYVVSKSCPEKNNSLFEKTKIDELVGR